MDRASGATEGADRTALNDAVKDLKVKALNAKARPKRQVDELRDTLIWLDEEEANLWLSQLKDDRFLNNLGRCSYCETIEARRHTAGFDEKPFKDLIHLKHMSLLGCHSCRMLFEEIFSVQLRPGGGFSFKESMGSVDDNIVTYQFGLLKIRFEVYTTEIGNANLTNNLTMRELLPDPLADSTLSIAQNWLKTCLLAHGSCSHSSSFHLPSRVIDVTGVNPRLRTLNSTGVPYTILSHCWGGTSTVTTTTSNMKDHEQCIKFDKLPKTFQNAVTVTQKMKINYLWIDSLCILQDSLDDWERESTKMGDYYGNSRLVLSALDSRNCHQGFLNQREEEISARISDKSKLCIRPAAIPYHERIRDAPLSQRGWVLQEQLLATRILHYGKDEMFWECLNCFERERSALTNLYRDYSPGGDYNSLGDLKRAIFTMNPNPFATYSGAYARWYQIITDFSRRTLTFDSDILPALSGLATIIQKKTRGNYMAGLWAEDVHGLVWCKDPPHRIVKHTGVLRKGRLENNCSWSWVSTRQSIRYLFSEEKRTDSKNDAIITEHSNLCLALSAVAQPVQCTPTYEGRAPYIIGFQGSDSPIRSKRSDNYDRDGLMLDIYNSSGSKIGIGCFDDSDKESTLLQCYAIWIAERVYDEPKQVPVVYFLLIVPVLPGAGVWKRVGMGVTREIWAVWPYVFFPTAFDGGIRKDFLLI